MRAPHIVGQRDTMRRGAIPPMLWALWAHGAFLSQRGATRSGAGAPMAWRFWRMWDMGHHFGTTPPHTHTHTTPHHTTRTARATHTTYYFSYIDKERVSQCPIVEVAPIAWAL